MWPILLCCISRGTSISGFLAHKLQSHTKLKTILAMDGLPIRRAYIYVAVPNHHLMLTESEVRLGPSESRWRPSIDVLFRSAATYFTNRVIGIVLTGLLNDGTSGMSGIKRSGGITIVQAPNEVEYPEMPFSVINAMEVDHVTSLTNMGLLLAELTRQPPRAENHKQAPEDVMLETEIAEKNITRIGATARMGNSTVYTCPDCGSVLFEHGQDAILKYKCHTGHSFTERDLLIRIPEETENSLWYAIRALEQRCSLYQTLTKRYRRTGNQLMANDYQRRMDEIRGHIDNLKKIIQSNLNQPNVD